jgi:V8-like Glu-specific endopeptidase
MPVVPSEVVGPRDDETIQEAREIRKRLQQGKDVDPARLHHLEQEVRTLRPSIVADRHHLRRLSPRLSRIFPEWETFRELCGPVLEAVARIELGSRGRRDAKATGFLVGKRLLMTNRHVTRYLTHGTGVLPAEPIRVSFGIESRRKPVGPIATVVSIVREHPTLDLAIAELDRADVEPLAFDTQLPQTAQQVAVVGYPGDDGGAPEYARTLFAGGFGIERVAPGEIIDVQAPMFTHDCSTLSGNSGSPVISLQTGSVLGVHAEGYYMDHNLAVQAGEAVAFIKQA